MTKKILIIILLLIAIHASWSQSVKELQKYYSGETSWDAKTLTLTFSSTGAIYFPFKTGTGKDPENDQKNHFWEVPKTVRTIIIKENVTVTGAFHAFNDLNISGENRKSSIVFGTNIETWADANNPGKQDLKEWYYAQFQNFNGTMSIQNLTILNPFSYLFLGYCPVIKLKNCDLIDTREGHHNHSDGFCGGDGSTVENCYFECGDDVFKTYFDYSVKNCSIKMRDNCVPIQLGWGNYSDGTVCTFRNIKIWGDSGRHNSDNAIISGRRGKFAVTIHINGLEINNPNAVLVSLWEKGMILNGTITNANIDLRNFSERRDAGNCNLTICNTSEKKKKYFCKN